MAVRTAAEVAKEIHEQIQRLDTKSTVSIRRVRAEASRNLRNHPGDAVIDIAAHLLDAHPWVAFELIYHHPEASGLVDEPTALRLAADLTDWATVDAYCRYVSGPAWRRGNLSDDLIASWAVSPDRWWRRAALVSTVPLNLRAAGGTGDSRRTLNVCGLLVDDRDDMVVKALSWALRALVIWDADAVRSFLEEHEGRLAARVRRDVTNKLETGLKHRR